MRKLVTIQGTHHLKADINRLYIERHDDVCGLVKLESTYNAAIVGLCKYFKQYKYRLTRLMKEYVRKTKYTLQKEAHLIKQKYI